MEMRNVRRPPYNAKGDGKADDSTAIQRAINDAIVSGGAVFVPAGVYLIGNGLRINGAVLLAGAGGPSDTDGGFATVPRTEIRYTGTGTAISVVGDQRQ